MEGEPQGGDSWRNLLGSKNVYGQKLCGKATGFNYIIFHLYFWKWWGGSFAKMWCPGFESGIFYNDPLAGHFEILWKSLVKRATFSCGKQTYHQDILIDGFRRLAVRLSALQILTDFPSCGGAWAAKEWTCPIYYQSQHYLVTFTVIILSYQTISLTRHFLQRYICFGPILYLCLIISYYLLRHNS